MLPDCGLRAVLAGPRQPTLHGCGSRAEVTRLSCETVMPDYSLRLRTGTPTGIVGEREGAVGRRMRAGRMHFAGEGLTKGP